MPKIRKALIPAAGLGTRFLPATKTVPKEMLTIVDAPIILYVVEEAIQAGIEDIILIAGRGKQAIEDFFDSSYELEDKLAREGHTHLLERLIKVRDKANIISIRQKQALGLGHAVLCGSPVIGNDPFAVLLGDEITTSDDHNSSLTSQLCQTFEEKGQSVVSIMEVEEKDVSRYGIADVAEKSGNCFRVKSLVEKPKPEEIQSRWALTGRYVFENQILNLLKDARPTVNKEIQLTDSMNFLAQRSPMWACSFDGTRYDAGDKLGYLKANVEIALKNPEFGLEFRKYLNEVNSRLNHNESGL